ncbi:MAG: AAA family ATPase [Candidatus Puniceispirillaceae bacterium]
MEVQFQNFRCFCDTGKVPIRPITILVGENSSGKTSFLAGLNHIVALLDDSPVDLNTAPFQLGSFKDIVFRSSAGAGFRSFTYRCFSENNVVGSWKFEDTAGAPELAESSVESGDGEFLSVDREGIKVQLALPIETRDALRALGVVLKKKKSKDLYRIDLRGAQHSRLFRRVMPQAFRNVFNRISRITFLIDDWISNLIEEAAEDNTQRDFRFKPRSIFVEFERRLRHMTRSNQYTRAKFRAFAPIRETPQRVYLHEGGVQSVHDSSGVHTPTKLLKLSQVSQEHWYSFKSDLEQFGRDSGLFEGIVPHPLVKRSQYPFEIRIKSKHGKTSNLRDVGYGVSQILPLLVEFLDPASNSGFLIQQPEVHLHPKAQAEFGTLMANLANKNKNFIVETHSDFILERIGLEIKKGRLDKDKVVILFFEPQQPEVKVHPIYLAADGSPNTAPPSYRKFFLEEYRRLWG